MQIEEPDAGASDSLAWGDVETWDDASLEDVGQAIRKNVNIIVNEQDEARRGDTSEFWVGEAGDAQRRAQKGLMKRLETEVTDLSAASKAMLEASDQIRAMKGFIRSVHSYAQQYKFAISHDGMVSDPHPPPLEPGATAHDAQLEHDTRAAAAGECADMISDVLTRAADIDGQLCWALQNSMIDEYGDGNATSLVNAAGYGASRVHFTAPITEPPQGVSAAEVAAWWQSMTTDQQKEVTNDHPDWIHNLDGVSYAARDQANRALLPTYLAQLRAQAKALDANTAPFPTTGPSTRFGLMETDDEANPKLAAVDQRIADLEGVQEALGSGHGEKTQLVTLDISRPEVEAAISVGDLDAAQHVAVYTPGFTSSGSNMHKSVSDLANLKAATSEYAGSKDASANVVWLGYQAPQLVDLDSPTQSVASEHAAKEGASRLASFMQGIRASHTTYTVDNKQVWHTKPVDLTAIGHSYGSLVTGLALSQGGDPDKVIFLGSPGIGVNHSEDLAVPSHNIYAESAVLDPVPPLNNIDAFKADPRHLSGVHDLDPSTRTTSNILGAPVTLTANVGHTNYFANGNTSQYDLAKIIMGDTRGIAYVKPPAKVTLKPLIEYK